MITHGEFLPDQFLCSAKGWQSVKGEHLFTNEEGDMNRVGSGEFSDREDVETTVKPIHVQLQEQLVDLVAQADKVCKGWEEDLNCLLCHLFLPFYKVRVA